MTTVRCGPSNDSPCPAPAAESTALLIADVSPCTPPYDCFIPEETPRSAPKSVPSKASKSPPKPRTPAASSESETVSIDAANLPADDRAMLVRVLNAMNTSVERLLVHYILSAPLKQAIAVYLASEMFADTLPLPGSIHFAQQRFHIPFQGDGQGIPTDWLPAVVEHAIYTPHFIGLIHFGPAMAFGLRATPLGTITLHSISDVTLISGHGGVRRLTELVFELSEGTVCAQATLDPPYDASRPGPQAKRCLAITFSDDEITHINRIAAQMDDHLGVFSPMKWALRVATVP